MKICADEHVADSIIEIVSGVCSFPDDEFLHVKDIGAQGIPDEIWVKKFAADGGEGIVTADAAMLKRSNEILAIGNARLKLMVLPSEYANSPKHLQMAFFLLWGPKMLDLFKAGPKAHYIKLPWNLRLPDKFSWEKIDLTVARQKANKTNRQNRQKPK